MTTYTVTDPNGSTHTRNTKRVYSHAVLAQDAADPIGYGVIGWAGSLQLAEKLLRSTEGARYPRPGTKGRLIYDGRLLYTDACLVNAREA